MITVELRMLTDAGAADTEQLIEWMRELWLTDTAPFNESLSRQALAQLLADPTLGRAWLLPGCAGYLILTFGFSLEYGGRDAFIDEFFIAAPHRGRGLGKAVLEEVVRLAPGLGVRAVHLEVADSNQGAEALYIRRGFHRHDRRLMTRWI